MMGLNGVLSLCILAYFRNTIDAWYNLGSGVEEWFVLWSDFFFLLKVGLKGRFQSFIVFAYSVLLETRKSLLFVQLNKITISSLKVFLEGF